jgi:tetratricopeptide (TPR) repeat protein
MMMRMLTATRRVALVLVWMAALGVTSQAVAQGEIGPKVAKPMKAAQEAIQKKQWDQALVKIDEADKVATKSAFEQFQINEFKGFVLLQQKKYGEVARIYEVNLNSGQLAPDQVNDRLKALIQLNTQVKNYPKVMEFGERWLKTGPQDVDTRVLVAQAHYLQKDYKGAIPVMEGAIKTAEQTGKGVNENWLQLLRSAQQMTGDNEGATKTLEKLVRMYPKSDYWDYLLSSRMRQNNSDRVQLNLLRLTGQVGVMNEADEYMELAEMLLDVGLPGEAQSVMETGFASKAFEASDKGIAEKAKRRLDQAKAAAAKDQQSLPTIEKDAQKSTTGQGDVALGMAYSSFGQYEKAAASLAQGLQKGGVRDPEQAQIMLGIANLKLGKKAEAIKAFDQVKGDPQMADVARLWSIVARSNAG